MVRRLPTYLKTYDQYVLLNRNDNYFQDNKSFPGQFFGIMDKNVLKNRFSKYDLYMMHTLVYCQGTKSFSNGNRKIGVYELLNFLSECFADCSSYNSQLSTENNNWWGCDHNTLNILLHSATDTGSICMFGLMIKNTYSVIIAKYKFKMKEKLIDNDSTKYRLFVVSSKMFEEAISESQKYHIQLAYTHVFPRDCRMFIAVPVYKDGYINEKDKIDKIE